MTDLGLCEQLSEGFFDDAYWHEVDGVFVSGQLVGIILGDEYLLEAEAGGFGDALFDACDGTDFAAEAHFGGKAVARGDGDVDVAGEDTAGHGEVDGGVADADAAGDVEEDILGAEFEATAFLEDGEEHGESAHLEAVGVALGRAVDCGADEGLHLDKHGAYAFEGGGHGGAAEVLVAVAEKQLGGVGDFAEAAA